MTDAEKFKSAREVLTDLRWLFDELLLGLGCPECKTSRDWRGEIEHGMGCRVGAIMDRINEVPYD